MSSVISFVRHRKLLLMALALFGLLAVDSLRPPAKQVSSGIYIAGVHAYQRVGRPVISRWVHCRCQPTCSEYSVQAVREHGIARGLLLTGCRLLTCLEVSIRACSEKHHEKLAACAGGVLRC